MIEHLRSTLKRVVGLSDVQSQREAMVDLLIWTMYADNILTLPENSRIDQLEEEMDWDSPMPIHQYVNLSIARVRDVLSDDDGAAVLLDDISGRLATKNMRKKAFEACRDLARADGQVADQETKFLNTVRERFEITSAE